MKLLEFLHPRHAGMHSAQQLEEIKVELMRRMAGVGPMPLDDEISGNWKQILRHLKVEQRPTIGRAMRDLWHGIVIALFLRTCRPPMSAQSPTPAYFHLDYDIYRDDDYPRSGCSLQITVDPRGKYFVVKEYLPNSICRGVYCPKAVPSVLRMVEVWLSGGSFRGMPDL